MQALSVKHIVNITLLSDASAVVQTAVAIFSLTHSKATNSIYRIYLLCIDVPRNSIENFCKLSTKTVQIEIIEIDTKKYLTLLERKPHGVSILSLCKLDLASILPDISKVLYIDSDTIIQKDLLSLYTYNIEKYYAGVVKEPVIYYWHNNDFCKTLNDYFNTGMLLLNLEKLRKEVMSLKLLAKKTNPLNCEDRDQDIFNLLFENQVLFLDITYNFLYTVFLENVKACGINEINTHYKTQYGDLEAICKDAVLIHFASRYKPWKYKNMVFSHTWLQLYKKTPFFYEPLPIQNDAFTGKHPLRALSFLECLKNKFKK